MESPTGFSRCIDIDESNVSRAVLSREAFRAFLARASAVARPEEGAAKVLVALARLATNECAWLEGDLRVEISGDDDETTISVTEELGQGFRERIFPETKLAAPFDEFVRAVMIMPRMIAPLRATETNGKLLLAAKPEARRSAAPPPIDIDERSLVAPAKSPSRRPSVRPRPARPSNHPTVARMAATRPEELPQPQAQARPRAEPPLDVFSKKTVARMPAVRPEEAPTPPVPPVTPPVKRGFGRPPKDIPADVFTKKTVVRMSAVRPEDMPEARRDDQKDIDDEWGKDGDD